MIHSADDARDQPNKASLLYFTAAKGEILIQLIMNDQPSKSIKHLRKYTD